MKALVFSDPLAVINLPSLQMLKTLDLFHILAKACLLSILAWKL